ncbi:MAG: thioredoxin family protein [Gammaproteobacteria bacterium]|nr:thioredoxin family protein [Gammaproteobacteria bacterium]
MSALIDDNPAYQGVTIMRVDWDTFRDDAIVRELQVPRRSTLIMFKNGEEIGRVVAKTSSADIEPLFKAATA